MAGGDWPVRARRAAVALMGLEARIAQETDQHIHLELLADIRTVFAEHGNPTTLKTTEIIDGLVAMEDRPWLTFTKGDKITPHRLAKILKTFGVERPRKERVGESTFRGYRFDAFADAFARYLPLEAEQAEQPNKSGPEVAKTKAEHEESVPLPKTAVSPDKHCSVPLVPLQTASRETGGAQNDDDDAAYFGA
jgi:putative DNA primase/helicase